jgi:hypothetical protein
MMQMLMNSSDADEVFDPTRNRTFVLFQGRLGHLVAQ